MSRRPLIYAGIGSRETPPNVLVHMTGIAKVLARNGWTLRSGGAKGADSAFEAGHRIAWHTWDYKLGPRPEMPMAIYPPWARFNGNSSPLYQEPSQEADDLAAKHHPNWAACSDVARKLHARNGYQILGGDLKTPCHYVICYTKGGTGAGGTGQALRIARAYEIPVFDFGLCHNEPEKLLEQLSDHIQLHHPDSTS